MNEKEQVLQWLDSVVANTKERRELDTNNGLGLRFCSGDLKVQFYRCLNKISDILGDDIGYIRVIDYGNDDEGNGIIRKSFIYKEVEFIEIQKGTIEQCLMEE